MPAKKKAELVTQQPVITPPILVKGMTEQQAINFIGERIQEHRNNVGPKKPWKDEELLVRHQLIINWLGQGMPTMDIARTMMNLWGITDSSAFAYLKEAMKYLSSSSDEYRDHMRDVQISKLERWAEECRLCGKYLEASKFQEQINKLLGLYQDKKVEVKGEGPIMISFGD